MTLSFPPRDEIARLSARMLLEIKAVHFSAEPFTYASGLKGPTYIDCRKLISYPRIRGTLMDFLAATVCRDAGFEAFDNIAGGEIAGIPFAAMVAERLALPMTYVRKKPKGYGRNARIEGLMTEGQRVLLVEDLTTDGGSKLSFVDAIRARACDRQLARQPLARPAHEALAVAVAHLPQLGRRALLHPLHDRRRHAPPLVAQLGVRPQLVGGR